MDLRICLFSVVVLLLNAGGGPTLVVGTFAECTLDYLVFWRPSGHLPPLLGGVYRPVVGEPPGNRSLLLFQNDAGYFLFTDDEVDSQDVRWYVGRNTTRAEVVASGVTAPSLLAYSERGNLSQAWEGEWFFRASLREPFSNISQAVDLEGLCEEDWCLAGPAGDPLDCGLQQRRCGPELSPPYTCGQCAPV